MTLVTSETGVGETNVMTTHSPMFHCIVYFHLSNNHAQPRNKSWD